MRWWHRKALASLPDETTQDRSELMTAEAEKLRRAQSMAAVMRAHDRTNNYAKRLRAAYAMTVAAEGQQ